MIDNVPDETVASDDWGRVDAGGTVYVRTADGERVVGSWQSGSPPSEGLEFFRRRFTQLEVQVDLLGRRLDSGAVQPEEAATAIKRLREEIRDAHAVGDLDGLLTRLDGLTGTVAARREEKRAARAVALEDARRAKQAVVDEAEQLAEGSDWRRGADRLRDMLEEWKALPRLERSVDDELWRRFSTARTHFTRRRKAQFAALGEQRDEARRVKEGLVAEAAALATSTDWAGTSRAYRELMTRWKAAGSAGKGVDDQLWNSFRGAQDAFFGARTESMAARDEGETAALAAKEALLREAEALLPVRDWKAAKAALRALHDRWDAAGRVPRDAMRSLDARLRRVEDAVRDAESHAWQRANPATRALAESMVTRLEGSIADLTAAREAAASAGDAAALARTDDALSAQHALLDQARATLSDLSG